MKIYGTGNETFLFVTGISVKQTLELYPGVCLLPVNKKLEFGTIAKKMPHNGDIAIAVLCAPFIGSQLKIEANDPETLAKKAWNAQWDIVLLSSILNTPANWNIQSDSAIENISKESLLYITHYRLDGSLLQPHKISYEESSWIKDNFINAKTLLDKAWQFETAVHSLASYSWHSLPRVQLAVLWAGIESLFGITSELSFRLGIYIANFLSHDISSAEDLLHKVKNMYKIRSSAVHGNKMQTDLQASVKEAAELLQTLIKRCVEQKSLPNIDKLNFFRQRD